MALAADYISLVLKGTRHGLLASIREDSDWSVLLSELTEISTGGRELFTDSSLTFDFGWRELTEEQFDSVIAVLTQQGLTCNGILSTSLNTRTIAEERGYRAIIGRLGLAKHHGRRMRKEQEEAEAVPVPATESAEPVSSEQSAQTDSPPSPNGVLSKEEKSEEKVQAIEIVMPTDSHPTVEAPSSDQASPEPPVVQAGREEGPQEAIQSVEQAAPVAPTPPIVAEESLEIPAPSSSESSLEHVLTPSQEGIHIPRYQDEEPTLYLRKTLRGGQKVVFAGNVVLLGDLNPGAAIEADGDIIVLGQLRGSVHAGAEGDRNSTVIASTLRATQLRIADCFWQGEKNSSIFKKSPLTGTLKARLDGDSVVVEALPVR